MSKNYERLISVVKQQVNEYKKCSPFLRVPKSQFKQERFWTLAGIHQSALFLLNQEEYFKFKEEAEKIESEIKGPKRKKKEATEVQMTLF